MLGPHYGNFHTQESRVVPGVPWKLECPERHYEYPGDTIDVSGKLVESQEELHDTKKEWYLHSGTMVTREGQGVMSGGEKTRLNAVRPCGMGVPPSEALI